MKKFEVEIECWKNAKKGEKINVIFKNLGYCVFQAQKLEKQLLLMIASYYKKETKKLDREIENIIRSIEKGNKTLGNMYRVEIQSRYDISSIDSLIIEKTIRDRNNIVHNYFKNKTSLLERDEDHLVMLRDLSVFYEKSEECIVILKKYFETFNEKYSINSFEIETIYNKYITNEEINIDTKLLVIESDFFQLNRDIFKPTSDDFQKWLQSIPQHMASFFNDRGLMNSMDVRDFQSFYFREINKISFEDYLSKKVSETEIEYWKTKESDKNAAQIKIENDPNLQSLLDLIYKNLDLKNDK